LAACLPIGKVLGRRLQLRRLSRAVALRLGAQVQRTRLVVLLATVVLTATAVAGGGPVALVPVPAPEVARHLTRQRGAPETSSALAGALLAIAADWVGRTAFAPVEIPVGVITAIVGGPYLLWILLRDPRRTA